jgi:hypothetical protein
MSAPAASRRQEVPEIPAAGGDGACRHCKSPLNEDARFCTVCELYQRRWFKAKSGVGYLTMVNALAATAALLINLVVLILPDSDWIANSELSVTTHRCYRDRVLIGIANRGRRFATIEAGAVTATGLPEAGGEPMTLGLLISPKQSVVDAKSVGVLNMRFLNSGGTPDAFGPFEAGQASEPGPSSNPAPACYYQVRLHYEDFKPLDQDGNTLGHRLRGFIRRLLHEDSAGFLAATCPCAPLTYKDAFAEARSQSVAPKSQSATEGVEPREVIAEEAQ